MTEQKIQEALAKHLDDLGILWTATANGGIRAKAAAAALKRSGVKRGVPDILIFTPPPSGVGVGLAIELKRPRQGKRPKGRVSDHQRIWMESLRATGWRAEVAYGFEHALEILIAAGYALQINNTEGD
jgi:hypothetical protein